MNKSFLSHLRDFIQSLRSNTEQGIENPLEVIKNILGGFLLTLITLILIFITLK